MSSKTRKCNHIYGIKWIDNNLWEAIYDEGHYWDKDIDEIFKYCPFCKIEFIEFEEIKTELGENYCRTKVKVTDKNVKQD